MGAELIGDYMHIMNSEITRFQAEVTEWEPRDCADMLQCAGQGLA